MNHAIKKRVVRPFGVLASVKKDTSGNLYIFDANVHRLEMRDKKWSTEIPAVEEKCKNLIGQFIHVATSQTTDNWSEFKYFCNAPTKPDVDKA